MSHGEKLPVIPSPCLLASSSLSVKEAIGLIVANNSSYLLLTNEHDVLSGIFTKTDILRVIHQLFSNPNLGDEQVHRFMTKPVKALSLELMHTAPEFMVRYGFQHVPITEFNNKTKTEKLIGIITSNSIFESMVKLRNIPPIFGGETAKHSRKIIGILGSDGSLFRLIESIFSKSFYVDVERLKFSGFDLTKAAKSIDALLLDLDESQNRVWLPIIQEAIKRPDLETVFVIYSKDKHKDIAQQLLNLENSGVFKIYEKPLNLSKLTLDLEKIWAESE